MSTKSEIVVCRASYCKVFSASFLRRSFSTATPDYNNNPKMLVRLGHFLRLKARPRRRDRAALHIAHSTSRTSSALPGHNIRTSRRQYARCTTRSARGPRPKEPTESQNGQASSGRSPDNGDSAPYLLLSVRVSSIPVPHNLLQWKHPLLRNLRRQRQFLERLCWLQYA